MGYESQRKSSMSSEYRKILRFSSVSAMVLVTYFASKEPSLPLNRSTWTTRERELHMIARWKHAKCGVQGLNFGGTPVFQANPRNLLALREHCNGVPLRGGVCRRRSAPARGCPAVPGHMWATCSSGNVSMVTFVRYLLDASALKRELHSSGLIHRRSKVSSFQRLVLGERPRPLRNDALDSPFLLRFQEAGRGIIVGNGTVYHVEISQGPVPSQHIGDGLKVVDTETTTVEVQFEKGAIVA
ncbi:hypothetical protein MRX96_021845 [Rhipicephalus microplus]